MSSFIDRIGSFLKRTPIRPETPTISIHDLEKAGLSSFADVMFDGDKFDGGFGTTQIQTVDYWTLRNRSSQLFNDNLYARGLIRRLITNEINTGLTPEASPDERIIGLEDDSLSEWTEEVENRFNLWGKTSHICDWKGAVTFGALQREARAEALISGDVLVVLRQDKLLKLPKVQLISGNSVQTPFAGDINIPKGHEIRHGVELNANNIVVAYWIRQNDGTFKRLEAKGKKTNRKQAWLVFGTDKRLDDVRGQPLLSLVLQSLKEIDRYRDSVQRKAVVNSILAMFIKKNADKMGSLPITGGAKRRTSETVVSEDGSKRKFNITKHIPGMVIEELQMGEEPVLQGGQGTDVNFGTFEEAIIQAVAWANEMPPEILRLAFSNNYSASQAAINEFKIYLNKIWAEWGDSFCTPIYVDWLISEHMNGKITSPSLLSSWRDPFKYDVFAAWIYADWYGSIKPSTDMLKAVKASELLVEGGYSTRSREARIMTGTKYSKNIKRLIKENEQLVLARDPLLKQEVEMTPQRVDPRTNETQQEAVAFSIIEATETLTELVADLQ